MTAQKRKAPSNIFKETDFYTIENVDGTRNLDLEHGLSGLESKFATVRDEKLSKQLPLTQEEHLYLAVFVAAAQFRTRSSRDHHASQWQNMLDLMDHTAESMAKASKEQKRAAAGIGTLVQSENSLSHEQVRQVAKKSPSVNDGRHPSGSNACTDENEHAYSQYR